MKTRGVACALTFLATAICLWTVPMVGSAHHAHLTFYDWCQPLTIEGRITRVEWKNPHSVIDVETNDGTTYHVEWTSAQIVARQYNGSLPAAVTVGARVVVVAHPMRDDATIRASYSEWKGNAVPNTVDPASIRRVDDTFRWTVTSPPDCSGR
jgi:hypothetical protein